MLSNSSILITGGTGSFGHTFVPMTLAKYNPRRLVIFSRDEMKQWEMAKLYSDDNRVRFFIGDVRDKDRLTRALNGIDWNRLCCPCRPNGVPRGLAGTAIPFDANNIESLREKVKGKEKQIAAIVIEPARGEDAPAGYLKALRELASEIGAVLIFDEITSGFRMCAGGIHRNYDMHPDLAVFAKSMANGYAMSVVMGTEKVMQAAQTTFISSISSTNWTDRIGPTAALATLKKYQRENAEKHLIATGNRVKDIWRQAAQASGIEINVTGLPSLAAFSFKARHPMRMNTRFTIEMLQEGFPGPILH